MKKLTVITILMFIALFFVIKADTQQPIKDNDPKLEISFEENITSSLIVVKVLGSDDFREKSLSLNYTGEKDKLWAWCQLPAQSDKVEVVIREDKYTSKFRLELIRMVQSKFYVRWWRVVQRIGYTQDRIIEMCDDGSYRLFTDNSWVSGVNGLQVLPGGWIALKNGRLRDYFPYSKPFQIPDTWMERIAREKGGVVWVRDVSLSDVKKLKNDRKSKTSEISELLAPDLLKKSGSKISTQDQRRGSSSPPKVVP